MRLEVLKCIYEENQIKNIYLDITESLENVLWISLLDLF